jgi:hypothetical protein
MEKNNLYQSKNLLSALVKYFYQKEEANAFNRFLLWYRFAVELKIG